MPDVHATAAAGFHAAADVYERARPGYPPAAVDLLVEHLGDGWVADVAAGTGKLTAPLAARGIRVIGVEPVEGMRRAFAAAVPGVPAMAATAEHLPFTDGALAAATVAQGFHWFDPHAAVASLARCIRPGGLLAVLWNVRDERVPWVRELTALIDPHQTGDKRVPRYRDQGWRAGFAPDGPFHEELVQDLPNVQEMSVEDLQARMASVSFIAVLPEEQRRGVLDAVSTLARTHPDLAGRDRFPLPYVTEVHLLRRAGSP